MMERLLEHLRRCANPRGLVLVKEPQLVKGLKSTPEKLTAALMALCESGKVRVLSPLPYLMVALLPRPWSRSGPHSVPNKQQNSGPSTHLQEEVPVSSRAATAIQQQEVGGAGEGEALLGEVLAVLGPEADRDEFRTILSGHSPALIYRCLRRVEATKAIRVSRAALFRSLLQKLSL